MRFRRTLVLLLIACFLRTLLPWSAASVEPTRLDVASASAFRCAGHSCCCATIDQCASACCCFPEDLGTLAPHPVFEVLSKTSPSAPMRVFESGRCGGGLPGSALPAAFSIVVVTPEPMCVDHAIAPSTSLGAGVVSAHTSRRPGPKPPPPRGVAHVG